MTDGLRRDASPDLAKLIRPAIRGLGVYGPAGPPIPENDLTFKLSQNESAFDPLPDVLRAALDGTRRMGRYPDGAAEELVDALARQLAVNHHEVVVGPGSIGVLQHLMLATVGVDDEVIYAWRSFEAYATLTTVAGGRSVKVPLRGAGQHDLAAMAAAITGRTRLILLCTPNNPTGSVIGADEFEAFMDAVPRSVLVVLDEAYVEYVRDPAAVEGLDAFGRHPNLVVLRTFSKAHGLAGLRVGYAIAPAAVAENVRKTSLPFAVSQIAQRAATESIGRADQVHERTRLTADLRDAVLAELANLEWEVHHSEGNFLWLPLKERSGEFAQAAREHGLILRPYGSDGVRVTVGSPIAMERFLCFARTWRDPVRAT